MAPEQFAELDAIFERVPLGFAILTCSDFTLLSINPFLLALFDASWPSQRLTGRRLAELLPANLFATVEPSLREVCATGKRKTWSEMPYEGLLISRGRTYWRVTVEPHAHRGRLISSQPEQDAPPSSTVPTLLVMVEDITAQARSRIYTHAVQQVTTAISSPFALRQVLEHILDAVQEIIGSTRCAILLIDPPTVQDDTDRGGPPGLPLNAPTRPGRDDYWGGSPSLATSSSGRGDVGTIVPTLSAVSAPTVTIAAQKGILQEEQDWPAQLSEHLLLNQVVREQRAIVITDTSQAPEMRFPPLDDEGVARRPGSVLCVPILDTSGAVIGGIEVYHRRARGFPVGEVELLEQFAQQAGLAIQNARLFLHMNLLAQDATRSARQRQILLHAIPDGIIIFDPRWRIAEMNDIIHGLLGWSDNVVGKPIAEAFALSCATFPTALGAMPETIEQLDRWVRERHIDDLKMLGADGRSYTMRRAFAPIHDAQGDIFASVVVYHDITELAEARERIEAEVVERTSELARTNEELRLLQRAREDFFTMMAHELKTPLANIRAHLSALLAQDLQWSADVQRVYLQTADEQVERLVRMINQFLDASRVEAGVLRLTKEPILLPEMLEDLQDRLEALITTSERALCIDLPPNLPAVLGDYELLMSVFINLLSNAFQHAPKQDTIRIEAEVVYQNMVGAGLAPALAPDSAHASDSALAPDSALAAKPTFASNEEREPVGVELRVVDHGPGLTPEQQASLFTRFSTFAALSRPALAQHDQPTGERLKADKRWSPSTGLGLYISRGIIEAHGSALELTSAPGEGARFAFLLPLATTTRPTAEWEKATR